MINTCVYNVIEQHLIEKILAHQSKSFQRRKTQILRKDETYKMSS